MNNKIILENVLKKINPEKEELELIDKFVTELKTILTKRIKKYKIDAEIFIGGSYAKKTLIKKENYDVDVFLRFNKRYNEKEISKLTEKLLSNIKEEWKISKVHGSRDYFKIDITPNFFIEVIPVIKIKNAKEARNITDLSYFHVEYIKKKLTKPIIEQIKIAKAFCHANDCYGAESYINGFSGYALELLIYHYKTFTTFLKNIVKIQEKEIIDIEKNYKNKMEVIMNMNGAKMNSPIILVDPTYKERNVLASLSEETFKKMKKVAEKFLKSPSEKMFKKNTIDFKKMEKNSKKRGIKFLLVEIRTDKQNGDIAGSKLLKFYKHVCSEIEKYYSITEKKFEYDNFQTARFGLSVKPKKEIIFIGPKEDDKKNVTLFKKMHKDTFVKDGRVYSKESISKDVHQFVNEWKSKNKRKIKEMYITYFEILS